MKLENRAPYYFTQKGISSIEKMRDAVYMGYWCGKSSKGKWNELPLDVFYQADPDVDAGHSHYFGLLVKDDQVLITDASSCFSEHMTGVVENNTVYVSRHRNDFVQTPGGKIIDGGRDYVKTNVPESALVKVKVVNENFEFITEESINDVEQQ